MAVLGLDFGNAYSYPSVVVKGTVHSLLPRHYQYGIPSCFYYDPKTGKNLCGGNALRYYERYPQYGIDSIKSKLMNSNDPDKPNITLGDENGKKEIFSLGTIAKEVIRYIIEIARTEFDQRFLGEQFPTEVTVAKPKGFGQQQEDYLRKYIEASGLKVKSFIPEPVAAALDYAEQYSLKDRVLVFDMGAGSVDIALLKATPSSQEPPYREVDSEGILSGAAGNAYDEAFCDFIISKGKKQNTSIDAKFWSDAKSFLKVVCRDAKERSYDSIASSVGTTGVDIPFSKDEFIIATQDVTKKSEELLEAFIRKHNLVNDSNLTAVLVGGSSRMPQIKDMVQKLCGLNVKVSGHNYENGISYGAARYGANESKLLRRSPARYSIQCERADGSRGFEPFKPFVQSGEELNEEKSVTMKFKILKGRQTAMVRLQEVTDIQSVQNTTQAEYPIDLLKPASHKIPINITVTVEKNGNRKIRIHCVYRYDRKVIPDREMTVPKRVERR